MKRLANLGIQRYAVALALLALTLAVRFVLDDTLGERQPLTLFFLPMLLAAWYGGTGPALVTAILGWLLAKWFFMPERGSLWVADVADGVMSAVYLFVSVVVAVIGGAMHRARRQAEQTALELALQKDRLEEMVQQRTAELQQSYERLRQSERMAALGTLAAGLAHDLGNLLMPMQARLESMERNSSAGSFTADLQALQTSAEYLQRLATGLRSMVRESDDSNAERLVQLQAWWRETQPLLKSVLPRGISLENRIPPDLPPIGIAAHALTQLVFNLVQNAGKAMHGQSGGMVSIVAERLPKGCSVRLGVLDNGPGMSEEVRKRCLEPFFTTGSSETSLGLGLTLVKGIVLQAGGSLEIESEIGRGSAFWATLPVATADGRTQDPSTTGVAFVSLRDLRLRSWTTAILQAQGFRVVQGEEPENVEAQLWVNDRSDGGGNASRQFLEGGRRRRVLVLADEASNAAAHADRVRILGSTPSPAEFRKAVIEVAHCLNSPPE